METPVLNNIGELCTIEEPKLEHRIIEEIALSYLKDREARIAMKMDHSILSRLK